VRIGAVLSIMQKDFELGSKNWIFIFAVLSPFIYTFFLGLIFGGFFREQPVFGIVDLGDSTLVSMAKDLEGWVVKTYGSEKALTKALESHVVDGGVVLPRDFDQLISKGRGPEITLMFSGQSYASHRLIMQNSLAKILRQVTGEDAPVRFKITVLGEEMGLSVKDRLTPFVLLAVIMIGGVFLTSMGIVEERETRTISAVTVTPASLGDVMTAKALMGFLIAMVSTFVTLFLNGITSVSYLTLILPFLVVGCAFAVFVGIVFGVTFSNSTELFGTIKGIGILLLAPALVLLFPKIPQWIGKIFPTYYIMNPIVKIGMFGAGWAEVRGEFVILVVVTVITAALAWAYLDRKKSRF